MKPRMLVAFDFSTSAERALAWAADLQRTTAAGPLRMVLAINPRPPGTEDVPLQQLLPNEGEIVRLKRSMVDAAERQGATALADVIIRSGHVGDIIVDAARGAESELIVMGTHGRTGVKRLFLGSVAEHVLRHAECPVLTVHASPGADSTAGDGSVS